MGLVVALVRDWWRHWVVCGLIVTLDGVAICCDFWTGLAVTMGIGYDFGWAIDGCFVGYYENARELEISGRLICKVKSTLRNRMVQHNGINRGVTNQNKLKFSQIHENEKQIK